MLGNLPETEKLRNLMTVIVEGIEIMNSILRIPRLRPHQVFLIDSVVRLCWDARKLASLLYGHYATGQFLETRMLLSSLQQNVKTKIEFSIGKTEGEITQ